ncbi:MAG: UbiA family prenyltransferase [Myxococcales bacterium]|nr:UbiA family prenyltransferase [Myxococcales bacterium]
MTTTSRSDLWSAIGDGASILRFHIILVAMTAAVVFSQLLTGSLQVDIALIGGLDWLLINLLNRITDLKEDLANQIRGTERVASNQRLFSIVWIVVFVGSFGYSLVALPQLTVWRVLVQAIGVGYSIAIVPTPSGLKRFKDLYFLKNFMSSMIFVLTVFVYPLLAADLAVIMPAGWWAVGTLVLFFVPFELTYEILYDMRDLEGDKLAGVPTYPVVHGLHRSRQIVDGLLVGSSVVLAVGLFAGWIGLREGLMLAATAIQWVFYRPRFRRGLTSRDCIMLTHLGSGLLLLFAVGTKIWVETGLPANIYVGLL